nr:pleckstrin homology domain-containing family A member 6 isoform X6 [Labrus bergylta]
MNGKINSERIPHSKSGNMVSELSPEGHTYTRTSRTPRKAATFGKRSNSMRRNPKAVVAKQGWLYKQASSGVKQWNKRWFILSDRCLFYYKDEKEESVLGSLPLLSFRVGGVELSDNITRKFAFKAEHAGTRTYFFSSDSHEEQEDWIRAMSQATQVTVKTETRTISDTPADITSVTKSPDPPTQQPPNTQTDSEAEPEPPLTKTNGVDCQETPPPSTPRSNTDGRSGVGAGKGEDEGGGPGPDTSAHPNHHPNGWSNHGSSKTLPPNNSSRIPPSRSHSVHAPPQGHTPFQGHLEGGGSPLQDPRDQQENVVLRRGFVPRTAPERVAQRKSSMAQLQQWVNQRRGVASQEDLHSPSRYYPVGRGVPADYYGFPGGPPFIEDYPLYPPGVRPDSICTMSAVGGYDRRWTVEEKRHSLRDGPHQLYGPPMSRDSWGPQYYGGMETSMRRLSIQPRSRSVPRSPSSSSGGPYSPVPHSFASPARSPSTRFDRFQGRMRDDVIYADPSVYGLRRSLSSPKYDYPGNRRSLSQGLYYNYPVSPSIHSKMVPDGSHLITRMLERSPSAAKLCVQVPPFHDVYRGELHPTLKLNEIETSKLLGRLCEQSRSLKDHEAVVHRLRMDKDSLEEALVVTHQEMELYHTQPLAMEKLRYKKETLQNQLINIRGELSQASSALTTTRMEFEALEDEASAIHGDLWEQLNAGGQFGEQIMGDVQEQLQDRQSSVNKVGIVPPRTKSPTDESHMGPARASRYNSRAQNGISRERPKSAVFTAEVKSKMSVEEQNERIRRNQSSSVRDKRRSLNLSGGQSPANYKVIRRRLTAHEIDIKDLEAAVRGQGLESPREEIARLRRLRIEPDHYELDIGKGLMAPDKVLIPERYLDVEDDTPLSPEEQKEKQKKLERIKTLIAKSNLQNMVPVLDGPVEGVAPVTSQQQLQEQEKRIEISCALAAEASRRSRILSAQCVPSPPTSPTSLAPPPSSADLPNSAHIMKV